MLRAHLSSVLFRWSKCREDTEDEDFLERAERLVAIRNLEEPPAANDGMCMSFGNSILSVYDILEIVHKSFIPMKLSLLSWNSYHLSLHQYGATYISLFNVHETLMKPHWDWPNFEYSELGISMAFNSNDIFKGVSDIKFGELDRLLARNQEQQVTTKMFEESGEDEDNAIEYF